jgi:transposase InsO family protein
VQFLPNLGTGDAPVDHSAALLPPRVEIHPGAQEFATQWLWTYNNERPNMGIGGITPAQKLAMAA